MYKNNQMMKECLEFYNEKTQNKVDVDKVLEGLELLLGRVSNFTGLMSGTSISNDLLTDSYMGDERVLSHILNTNSWYKFFQWTYENKSTAHVTTFCDIPYTEYNLFILDMSLDYTYDDNGVLEIEIRHYDINGQVSSMTLLDEHDTNIVDMKHECDKFITSSIQEDFKIMDKLQDILFEVSESIYDEMDEE